MSSENNPFIQSKTDPPGIAANCSGSRKSAQDYNQGMITSDGNYVCIRTINCNDKNKLQEFHKRLSAESLYLRYQYSRGELTDKELQAFCSVDYDNTLGLVAEVKINEQSQIIGVGRYARLNNPIYAEMAFIVQDSEQNKGIGTQLLRHLAILGWQQGIQYFVGELLRHNGRMINILRKSDPTLNQLTEDKTCTITIKVYDARKNTPSAWNVTSCL